MPFLSTSRQQTAVGGTAMRWLLLFVALAAQNEVRGLYVAAHKHSVLENDTHDHHHEPEHEQVRTTYTASEP